MSKSPFTGQEQIVIDKLVEAWGEYLKLDITHPQHNNDFGQAIRQCQNVIQHKLLQRKYPETFPTYKKEKSYE